LQVTLFSSTFKVEIMDYHSEAVMPVIAIHPGEHLAEVLKALEMSAAELARKISVPTNRVTQILNGTRSITGDTALRLGHFFGTSPQFWLNLQTLYDVRIAEQKAGKAIRNLPKLKRKELVEV
jgi:addiction module HigA family antidote